MGENKLKTGPTITKLMSLFLKYSHIEKFWSSLKFWWQPDYKKYPGYKKLLYDSTTLLVRVIKLLLEL